MSVALIFAESVLGIGSDSVSIPEALVVISRRTSANWAATASGVG